VKAGGFLSIAIVAALLTAFTVPAAAHHPYEDTASSSLSLLGGSKRPAIGKMVAKAPPLTGTGQNLQLVANVPLAPGEVPKGANDTDFVNNAADIELAGNYAFVGSYTQGLVIVNISSCRDPSRPQLCKPFVQSVLKCSGGQFDVQLSPDARYVVMAHESASANKACHPSEEGAQVIDVGNKSAPREVAFISDKTAGQVVDGAHNVTLDWPNLYIDNYTQTYPRTDVFSLANPAAPKRIGQIDFISNPGNGGSGPHDSIPDHRPDGKDLLYAASIQKSDVVDISNPSKPRVLQTITDPEVGISHGAEPSFNRKTLIVTDEYGGGSGVGACGGSPDDPSLPLPGPLAGSKGVGAVHFYGLAGNGLVPGGAADKQGTFNIPFQANEPAQVLAEAGCTSHVFWQALDQSRFVIAWYGRGTRVVDFSDPANPRQLAFFIPTSADTWSAKPHRGFIFTGDMVRGMDVLLYKGESGRAWPTTSGPADIQRALVQGCPDKGAAGRCPAGLLSRTASGRLVISRRTRRASRRGRFGIRMACKQATTCRGTLRLSVRSRRGARSKRTTIARKRFAIPSGRTTTVKVKLSRRGRRLLRTKRRLRVEAFARLQAVPGANTRGLTAKTFFRLKAPRRR
jgi:hypothetical protein